MVCKFYVFFLLAVIGITNGWKIEILNKEKIDMVVGKNMSIVCNVSLEEGDSKDLMPSILWYKDGNKVPDEKIKYRGATKSDPSKTLNFKNPTKEDNGRYMCVAEVTDDPKSTKNETIKINFEVGVDFINTPAEQYPKDGETAKILCSVTGEGVTMNWIKNGSIIKASSKYSFTDGRGSRTLLISNFTKQDNGIYTCRWSQGLKQGALDINVTSYEKPKIIHLSTITHVFEGHNAEVDCIASGNPKPRLQWYKTNSIGSQTLADYLDEFKNGTLILRNIRLSDAGSYKCVAHSEIDTSYRVLQVNVIAKPKIFSFKEEYVLDKGANITLQCKFLGGGRLQASWIKDGEVKAQEVFPAYNSSRVLNLTLNDVSYEQLGKYKCLVSNEAGAVSHTAKIKIHLPPRVRHHQDVYEVYVAPSTSLGLICNAIGYPEPSWTWYFNNATKKLDLAKEKHAKIHVREDGKSELDISEFLEQHYGNYTCVARNINGNHNVTVTIFKKVPPSAPSLECFTYNATTIHCIDNAATNVTAQNAPTSYSLYYLDEKDAKEDCCRKSLKNCTALQQNVANLDGHLWIYDLKPSTKYVLQAAAMNDAGTSEMSACIHTPTQGTSSDTSIWLIVLYIIIALLALALLIDLLCCITKGRGMFAALYRRCRSKLHNSNEDSPIIEETEVTYESNVLTGSNFNREHLRK